MAKTITLPCPHCGGGESEVLETRAVKGGVYRRRRCLECKQRFTTTEAIGGARSKGPRRKYTALRNLHADLTALLEELGVQRG